MSHLPPHNHAPVNMRSHSGADATAPRPSPPLRLPPEAVRKTPGGLFIDLPKGPVLLRLRRRRITATYVGRQLVNGSAGAYAARVRDAALRTAIAHSPGWTEGPDGSPRITDHRSFYEATFRPAAPALETLRTWITDH